jgi:hypothetical protein
LSRRGFLGATGVLAGTFPLVAAARTPVGEATSALSAEEEAVILQVARVGATLPVTFPSFGERGPATSRATAGRLRAAAGRVDAERLALARSGARHLVEAGLLDAGKEQLLAGIGSRAVAARNGGERWAEPSEPSEPGGPTEQTQALVAMVALAIATVSRHFDPGSDHAAALWVGSLRRLAERGERPQAVRHLEAR